MGGELDFSKLTPCERFAGENAEDTELVAEMLVQARTYLSSFPWCNAIERLSFLDREILASHSGDLEATGQ